MAAHKRKRHYVLISALFLLYWLCIIGAASCQQPVSKPLASPGHSKASKKNPDGSHNQGDTGKPQKPKKQEHFHTMNIPKTLSRTPKEMQERQETESSPKTTDPEINADGIPVKYEEKEVSYSISAALGDNLLLDPEYDKIYPGAVLVGDSIDEGSYREIHRGKKRESLISFSLQGVKDKNGQAGKISGKIKPDLAAYRQLHNEILSQKITFTPSVGSKFEEMVIKSQSSFDAHLKFGVGFGAGRLKNKIGGGFKFEKGDKKHRHLIRFTETFYTADVNEDALPMMTDIPREVLGNTMPVYVSSVTYGRVAYLLIESKKSWAELKQHFDTAFKISPASVDGKAELALSQLADMTETTIHIIGGSKHSVTTLGQFKDYIVNGGFSSGNPGQIIKYKLKFLGDDSLAHIKYKENYRVTERKPIVSKGIRLDTKIKAITATKDMTVFGSIKLKRHNSSDNGQLLLDKNKNQALALKQNRILVLENQLKRINELKANEDIALVFDLYQTGWGFGGSSFVTDADKQSNEPVVFKVKDLLSGGNKKIILYQKGNKNEKITVDIQFITQLLF